MTSEENQNLYIEIKFGPQWKYISTARGFIQSFLAIATGDEERSDKAAMATSELLENAVKYSAHHETGLRMEVERKNKKIVIAVENQAKPEHITTLKDFFDLINSKDPLEAYVDQMKHSVTSDDGKSQLGLVRIRYEANAEMTMSIVDDNTVSIRLEI